MKAIIAGLLMMLLLPLLASAATIKGSVYDFSLQKINGVVLDVDSTPKQQIIAPKGDYMFNLGQGAYTIAAKQLKGGRTIANATEKIIIDKEGEFNLDLILLPNFEDISIGDVNLNQNDFAESRADFVLIFGFGIVGVILVMIFLKIRQIRKEKPKEIVREIVKERVKEIKEVKVEKLPEDLEKALEFIKSQGSRVNQKDIRKHMNLSEAKISLMMDDLESRGIVKKIKKGRGNIIVLN